MKGNTVRWIIAVLMLVALTIGLSCPAIVEAEGAKLPLDYTVGGSKTDKADWEYDRKIPIGYKDDTIEVTAVKGSVTLPGASVNLMALDRMLMRTCLSFMSSPI